MTMLFMAFLFSTGLYAQQQDTTVVDIGLSGKETTILRTYHDDAGNRVDESYNKSIDALRWRTTYKEDSDIKLFYEKYRRSSGTLETKTYYDREGTKYSEELYTNTGILDKIRFFYSGMVCEEAYNPAGELIKRTLRYASDGELLKEEKGAKAQPCPKLFTRLPE